MALAQAQLRGSRVGCKKHAETSLNACNCCGISVCNSSLVQGCWMPKSGFFLYLAIDGVLLPGNSMPLKLLLQREGSLCSSSVDWLNLLAFHFGSAVTYWLSKLKILIWCGEFLFFLLCMTFFSGVFCNTILHRTPYSEESLSAELKCPRPSPQDSTLESQSSPPNSSVCLFRLRQKNSRRWPIATYYSERCSLFAKS